MPNNRPSSNGLSVLHPDHPANWWHEEVNSSSYTYRSRQRDTKLNFTLGWELEANRSACRTPSGVQRHSDGSVNGDSTEYVVMPAVTRSPRYVLGLLKDLVHTPNLNTDDSTGFHVHVSAADVPLNQLRQWAIATEHLGLQVQDLAFKAVPESRSGNQYCRKIQPITNGTQFYVNKYDNPTRYHWLNIVEMFRPGGIRTMEIRLLGHTHRWKYLLAWTLFCLELSRRGWILSQKSFDSVQDHVEGLSDILRRIENEVKPLSRRSEPIPQWVYNGLATFGMPAGAWDRPLSKLTETEASLKGLILPVYSDNQPEVPNDEDEESCSCGCRSDERCSYQVCEDGDCDPNECERCHENGSCEGEGNCYYCDRSSSRRRQREILRPVATSSNVSVNMTGMVTGRVSSQPITAESMRQAVAYMRNIVVDNEALRMPLPVIYGRGIPDMVWLDESAHVPQTFVEPTQETERRAYAMLTPLERDASMERSEMTRGCPMGCTDVHTTVNCLMCGQGWGDHRGHVCDRGGNGSFPIRGGR